ncbi:MAG: endonuclease/exonuclease/phosphatase family protein [Bacteroidales bacterium]|jgi:endonuclease/exonuclease/phosphatase family metal-dependent hydrolase|nr:endonuclease/exonuclease/phosphatase family protein [Bacteroidales bacterium]
MKKILVLLLSVFIVFPGYTQKKNKKSPEKCILRVASYNIWVNATSWPDRRDAVSSLVRFHDFDIFGTQEGTKPMLDDINRAGGYAYIGEGRDGGVKGEFSAIFYKTDRFDVLDNGNFWYSETPEVPGKGWDAVCCNRICSWGKFRDKVSGREFYFFNSHYDHQGKKARVESSKLLLLKIKEIAANYPIFATGDYNATPESESIRILLDDGLLKDSYTLSKQPPYGTVGTFQGLKVDAEMKTRIDFIFVTDHVNILKYGVLNDRPYGRCPSDHDPVMIVAEF